MNRIAHVILLFLVLTGCSSGLSVTKTQYLKTGMQSAASGLTTVVVPADSLLKEKNTRKVILYPLRPLPGKAFRTALDRKFAAATINIILSPGRNNRTADISGEINYYDLERYVNARLVSDSIRSLFVAPQKVQLKINEPVFITLPQGIQYSLMLTDSPF